MAKFKKHKKKNDAEKGYTLADVENTTDPAVLRTIIFKSKNDDKVCEAAVKKITDPEILTAFALKNTAIAPLAAGQITGQALLTTIARESKSRQARKEAVGKITDQAVLAEIFQNDKDHDVRYTSSDKLTDETLLTKLAQSGKEEVRKRAESRLKQIDAERNPMKYAKEKEEADGWIYFTSSWRNGIFKGRTDGSDVTCIYSGKCSNIECRSGWIFFKKEETYTELDESGYLFDHYIDTISCKMKPDGTELSEEGRSRSYWRSSD